MTKKYRLGIAAIVSAAVSLQVANADGETETHEFTVTGTRYGNKEQAELFSTLTPEAFLKKALTGWSGQTLVLEDDGKPAAFSAEALEAMFDIQGVGMVVFNSFVKASAATEKNSNGSRTARP